MRDSASYAAIPVMCIPEATLLRSNTALRLRRGLARRADAMLATLRLVDDRAPAPAPSAVWAVPGEPPVAEPEPVPQPVHGLTREAVQQVLDEMVRPALQSDGGDIALLRVDGGDVYVSLVGACHSCPSAVLTMKMGVEGLLAEELEGFERLIQVDGPQQAAH